MSAKSKGFRSEQYNCPYRFKCGCYVALSVKYYSDKVVLMQAGEHDLNSHTKKRGLLTVKQRGAVKRAARSAPLQVGRQIQDSLLDCSPGKHIPYDRRHQNAVGRLVRKTRKEVMGKCIPGVGVDGSEGSMNRLASQPIYIIGVAGWLPATALLCNAEQLAQRKAELMTSGAPTGGRISQPSQVPPTPQRPR